MKTRILLLITTLFILLPSASSANCSIRPAKQEKLLSMSYGAFDQTENGWRQYANSSCYHKMGMLIDMYQHQNKNTLLDWQIIGLTWHAGQMYAFNHEYEIAKIRFQHSINPNEPENTPVLWNDYVQATIAFLNNNMLQLKLYRDKIAQGPNFNGKKLNLDIVDRLIQYFGRPYSAAYQHRNS